MTIQLPRRKPRNLLLSVIYRLAKLPFASRKKKLALFLDLEWITARIAHELSHRVFSEDKHPARITSYAFLMQHIQPEHRVLDLGCNTGDITATIATVAKEVVGVDHERGHIERARTRHQGANVRFFQGDAIAYVRESGESFDVLILSHILEHLDDPEGLLVDSVRIFDFLYIEVPDFDALHLNHYRKALGMGLIYGDNDHVFEFDRCTLQEMFDRAGLEIEASEFRFGLQKYWCRSRRKGSLPTQP